MNQKDFIALLGKPTHLYEKFHSKTKLSSVTLKKKTPSEWKNLYYKGYTRFKEITLPSPSLPSSISLKTALNSRKTKRTFSKNPLSLSQLSTLLYYSAGINADTGKRFYPSAGTRYPLEVYLISQNTDLPKGIYHYYVKNNSLEKLFPINHSLINQAFELRYIKNAPCIIIISAVFGRTVTKYSERGYRYIFLEAGHLMHNLQLVNSAIGCSSCLVGGFIDDKLNKLLELDGKEEAVIYACALGNSV